MRIGPYNLERDILIVAEIGNNHEGEYEVAERLVREAAACGVQAVKFQTFRARTCVSPRDPIRYHRLASFELTMEEFEKLEKLARSLGLLFLSTPLDLESARMLEPLVDAYKIASGDNNFYPLIEEVCRTGKPVIISSGVSEIQDLKEAKQFAETCWKRLGVKQETAFLHCVSSYPVPEEEANLGAITHLKQELGCAVGYSDHTVGIEACVLAAALGACIVEKHFTLDKNYSDFRDHRLSSDPDEMRELVNRVRRVRLLLGDGRKKIERCEEKLVREIRRSIVASADLPSGHRLSRADLMWVRPADGLPPGEEHRLIGKTLKRPLGFGEPVCGTDVE